MNGQLVVKRYARALFDAAENMNSLDSVRKDITVISEILKEPEIRKFCLKKGTNYNVTVKFINTAFIPFIGELTGRLVLLMLENGRMEALPFLESAFHELLEKRNNIVSILLETAEPSGDSLTAVIKQKMSLRLNKKINLKTVTKPSIIGGFRILWQNRIIDMSVSGKIKKLKLILK